MVNVLPRVSLVYCTDIFTLLHRFKALTIAQHIFTLLWCIAHSCWYILEQKIPASSDHRKIRSGPLQYTCLGHWFIYTSKVASCMLALCRRKINHKSKRSHMCCWRVPDVSIAWCDFIIKVWWFADLDAPLLRYCLLAQLILCICLWATSVLTAVPMSQAQQKISGTSDVEVLLLDDSSVYACTEKQLELLYGPYAGDHVFIFAPSESF